LRMGCCASAPKETLEDRERSAEARRRAAEAAERRQAQFANSAVGRNAYRQEAQLKREREAQAQGGLGAGEPTLKWNVG